MSPAPTRCTPQSTPRGAGRSVVFSVVYGLVPLAAAAALKGDHAWVARIIGWRDAITGRTGAALVDPMMRELGDRIEREARARLGPGGGIDLTPGRLLYERAAWELR